MTPLKPLRHRAALIFALCAVCAWPTASLMSQSVAPLPFETDFESEEGYTLGPWEADAWWQFGAGLNANVLSPGAGSDQAVGFNGGEALWLSTDSGNAPVTWVDFYLKPVFVELEDRPVASGDGMSAVTAFLNVLGAGEVQALDGDGLGAGSWIGSPAQLPLMEDSSMNWVRLTYRLDYASKRWDLFVDGDLVLADLGFLDSSSTELSFFAAYSDATTDTLLDYFYAGNENPLYIDSSNDGLPDSWVSAQGLSIYSSQRYGDADFDGLDNLTEYQLSTRADLADTDGDGVHDGAELSQFADPTVANAYSLTLLPFEEGFESHPEGVLSSLNNWSIAGDSVYVQSADFYADALALEVGAASSASNQINGAGEAVVWVDLYLKPTAAQESPELNTDSSVAYYFNSEGRPVVFDGSGGNGSGFWKLLDVAKSEDWRRVTVKLNYAAQAYDFYLDGERLEAGLGFAHTQPYLSRLQVSETTFVDGIVMGTVEPSNLDDDRDGVTNADEAAAGTDPLAFDSDGDGLADSLELLWGLDPTVADVTLAQPTEVGPGVHVWVTTFASAEGYTVGDLDGQNDWDASGAAEITALEESSLSDNASTDAILERMAGMGEHRRVWVSFRAKLVVGVLPSLDASSEPFAGALGASSASTLAVWDDASTDWMSIDTDADLVDWNEYALYFDYVDKVWTLCLNGVIVASDLPFNDVNLSTFSRFKALQLKVEEAESNFESSTAYFDGIRFANTEPADMDFDGDGLVNDVERQLGSDPLLADSDGDGMDDLWEHTYGLSILLDDAGVDLDGDGMDNIDEYAFNRDPTLQDIQGVSGYASLKRWDGVQGAYLSNLTNDSRFPLNPDHFTFLESLTTEYSADGLSTYGQRINGTITAPVTGQYTFWVSGDARVEFWLSSDHTPFGKKLIAQLKEATGFQQWTEYASQVSMSVELLAGQSYYFELLHTEGSGKDHVSVAWQYPGQSRLVVPGDYLSSAISYVNDVDEDGLPDDWEVAVGLDASKGFGTSGYNGDADGDGLKNYQEREHNTNPEVADTDRDGVPDLIEIETYFGNPLIDDIGTRKLSQKLSIADGFALKGEWGADATGVYSESSGGTFRQPVNILESGQYELVIAAYPKSQHGRVSSDYEVYISVDGQHVSNVHFDMYDGASSERTMLLPWLDSGQHNIDLRFINFDQDRNIGFSSFSLFCRDGFDADENGRPDWIDNRLQLNNGIDPDVHESYVSPYCLEGHSRYPNFVAIDGSVAGAAPGDRWFANVELSPTTSVAGQVSFENGGHVEDFELNWLETNIISNNNSTYRIREGDSLLLNAHPVGASQGSITVQLLGEAPIHASVDAAVPVVFDSAGTFLIDGVWTDGAQTASGQVSVEVVRAEFQEAPIALVGSARSWVSGISSNVVIESDSRGNFKESGSDSVTGERAFEVSTDILAPRYFVSRLSVGGAILDSQHILGLRAATTSATAYRLVEMYEDGTGLYEVSVVLTNVYPTVEAHVDIFVGGVMFDDGSRYKVLKAEDFDANGVANVYFIRPGSARSSICHRTYIYDSNVKLGRPGG
ncbi:MAG TPA: hypothetical protein DEA90_06180 [Opitutae bacterium]|nr:hypothetical protein [Puniceicoccaceae bacterium]HBR93734.1 hypothetical protein [Opitutae bacterium]